VRIREGFREVRLQGFVGFAQEPWSYPVSLEELSAEVGAASGKVLKMRRNRAVKIRSGLHVKEEFLQGKDLLLLLKAALGRGRLKRQWRSSLRAWERQIPCPQPLAFLEGRRWGLPRRAVLVTPYMEDFLTLTRFLRLKPEGELWYSRQGEDFLRDLAWQVRSMHERGMVHGDLKGSNILVREEERGWVFLFTDLKGSRFPKRIARKVNRGEREDILRLLASLRPFFPASARRHFLDQYLARAGWTEGARACWLSRFRFRSVLMGEVGNGKE
jgi:hypothetical protein